MTIAPEAPAQVAPLKPVTFLELELTGRCQLSCTHCYAESGPTKGHGSMTADDWRRVIDEAAATGVVTVQFIGGEPTMHPAFEDLVAYALNADLRVEVYSNLIRVKATHWTLYNHRRVSLSTSYYSDDPAEHDAITRRPGSHDSTRANIIEALRRDIPVKVGIIHVNDGQRTREALVEMWGLGVRSARIDGERAVGNALGGVSLPSTSALCGKCADGKAAVLPDGQVAPCVMARFLSTGNVKEGSLSGVLASPQWAGVAASIPRPGRRAGCLPDEDSCQPAPFTGGSEAAGGCLPDEDSCQPAPYTGRPDTTVSLQGCNPDNDGSDCSPAETPACNPAY